MGAHREHLQGGGGGHEPVSSDSLAMGPVVAGAVVGDEHVAAAVCAARVGEPAQHGREDAGGGLFRLRTRVPLQVAYTC